MIFSKQTAQWGTVVFLSLSLLAVSRSNAAVSGEAVFNGTCVMCHKSGVMGAPKFGDAKDWGARLAQGREALYSHAINGFQGKKGKMPPRGGKPSLTDDEVKAAVGYMLDNAK